MRHRNSAYRNEPKVIAIAATRKNTLPALLFNLLLASLLYGLFLGLLG